MDRDAINAVLKRIAHETVLSEFWVSDENGEIAFTNMEGADFAFPTDPGADSQAAPFAALLTGDQTVVVQEPGPRLLDGAVFQYVGVAGSGSAPDRAGGTRGSGARPALTAQELRGPPISADRESAGRPSPGPTGPDRAGGGPFRAPPSRVSAPAGNRTQTHKRSASLPGTLSL